MTRPIEFKTVEIDLAAAIMTATGDKPEIRPTSQLMEFIFCSSDAREIAADFASGFLMQPVKKFAACRNLLWKQIKGGAL